MGSWGHPLMGQLRPSTYCGSVGDNNSRKSGVVLDFGLIPGLFGRDRRGLSLSPWKGASAGARLRIIDVASARPKLSLSRGVAKEI